MEAILEAANHSVIGATWHEILRHMDLSSKVFGDYYSLPDYPKHPQYTENPTNKDRTIGKR